MAIPALNFTGFVEKKGLFSYRELFASEASLLKGKPLCQYLTDMDLQEYEAVKLENAEFGKWDEIALSTIAITGLAIGIIAAFGFFFADKISEALPISNSESIMSTSGAIAIGSSAAGLGAMLTEDKKLKTKVNPIYDNRLLRLQDKVRTLESRIALVQDLQEKEQLMQAKDHFSLKQQRYLAEKVNVINVKK